MALCLSGLTSLPSLSSFTHDSTGGRVMKRLCMGALAVVTMVLLAAPVEAFGHRRHRGDCGDYSGYAAAAPACETAGYGMAAVAYQEEVRTGYRPEMRTRTVM